MSLVIDLIDLVAKHKSGELRCPATALIVFAYADCWFSYEAAQISQYSNKKQSIFMDLLK